MASKMLLTIDEYAQLPDTGVRTELLDGAVVGLASGNLMHTLARDATGGALHMLGIGLSAVEVEFRTVNDQVRRADAVWFAAGRLAQSDLSRNILPVPDLAVEVVSPTDLAADVRAKVREYLEAGVTSVWMIYLGIGASAVSDYLIADCLPGVSIPIEGVFSRNIEQA